MTGGLGSTLWAIFDTVLRFGGVGVIRPPGEIMQLPVINRLHISAGNQGLMTSYYEFSDLMYRAPSMLNAARTPQERVQIRKDNRNELIAANQLKPIRKQMTKFRKDKEAIRLNVGGRLSRDQQRKKLDRIENMERKVLIRAKKIEEKMYERKARG